MSKFSFVPDDLRRGFNVAKLVKPVSGDFVLKMESGRLVVSSSDRRRRFTRAEIAPVKSDDPSFTSGEFFLPKDRLALFETDLTQVVISITEKGLNIKAEDGSQVRQANVKKRLENSKRPAMPARPPSAGTTIPSKHLEELLHQVSCSALVKDTKTEEDMKVNQVHFYPDECMASSSARFYGSICTLPGLSLSLSIVSSDLPALISFCARAKSENVVFAQSGTHLVLTDPDTYSSIVCARVASAKPALQVLPEEGYSSVIRADQAQLKKALSWATMATDGTQRVTIEASGPSDEDIPLTVTSGGQELSRIPVRFIEGNSLRADFPVRVLTQIVGYLSEGRTLLKYGHKRAPNILEVCSDSDSSPVRSRHFLTSMKDRK